MPQIVRSPPIARRVRLSDGTVLDVAALADGEFAKRSGAQLLGGLPQSVETGVLSCPEAVSVLDAVYVTSTGSVDRADADGSGTFPTIGLVKSKPTSTTCIVQRSGELAGLAGLTAGAVHFLSGTPGQVTATAPISAGAAVQYVGVALSSTVLLIIPSLEVVIL